MIIVLNLLRRACGAAPQDATSEIIKRRRPGAYAQKEAAMKSMIFWVFGLMAMLGPIFLSS